MNTAKHPLVPLNTARTRKVRDRSTGRQTIWLAYTRDDAYEFERHDDETTTWTVTHVESRRFATHFPTLRSARISVATGAIDGELRDAE